MAIGNDKTGALTCRNVLKLAHPETQYPCLNSYFTVNQDSTITCGTCKKNWKIPELIALQSTTVTTDVS